jgi:hypothetical protein
MAPRNTKFSLEFLATLDRDDIVERLLEMAGSNSFFDTGGQELGEVFTV